MGKEAKAKKMRKEVRRVVEAQQFDAIGAFKYLLTFKDVAEFIRERFEFIELNGKSIIKRKEPVVDVGVPKEELLTTTGEDSAEEDVVAAGGTVASLP